MSVCELKRSKSATQRQECPFNFGTPKAVVFIGSTSLDDSVDVIVNVARMLYSLGQRPIRFSECFAAVC